MNRHHQLSAHVSSSPSFKIFWKVAPLPYPVYVGSMKGKNGAHFFWSGALHIRISLVTNVINCTLPWVTAFFYSALWYFFFPISECLPTYCHDGEVRDFRCEQLQKRANKTSFLKVCKPWPPSSSPELMGGHQRQGTHAVCQSLWYSAPPSAEPWWTHFLLCSSQTASKISFQNTVPHTTSTHSYCFLFVFQTQFEGWQPEST